MGFCQRGCWGRGLGHLQGSLCSTFCREVAVTVFKSEYRGGKRDVPLTSLTAVKVGYVGCQDWGCEFPVSPTSLAQGQFPLPQGRGWNPCRGCAFGNGKCLTAYLHPRVWWTNKMKREHFGFYKMPQVVLWVFIFFLFFSPLFLTLPGILLAPQCCEPRCAYL